MSFYVCLRKSIWWFTMWDNRYFYTFYGKSNHLGCNNPMPRHGISPNTDQYLPIKGHHIFSSVLIQDLHAHIYSTYWPLLLSNVIWMWVMGQSLFWVKYIKVQQKLKFSSLSSKVTVFVASMNKINNYSKQKLLQCAFEHMSIDLRQAWKNVNLSFKQVGYGHDLTLNSH